MQITFPLLVQVFTTPCHLFALDLFTHEKALFRDRMGRVARRCIPSGLVRMCTMFPPWSIGLLINRDLRKYLIDRQERM